MAIYILVRWERSNDWLRSPAYEDRERAERDLEKIDAWIGHPGPHVGIPWLKDRGGTDFHRAYIEDDSEITR